ncbi:hypothetical protein MKW98_018775 [Papaver atlanticum]|uniref:Uncharacterized protein n=1 Tax=Papaver atlanticum TaxID=357466 RepID=A0AAD4T618_9MAGN|nr:hypothetical protein MKW98_018775 [Papaver atlanticum]
MEEKLNSEVMVKGLDYFPSGSIIDGISAALLASCKIKKILLKDVLPKLTLSSVALDSDLVRDSRYESELYT